MAAGLRRGPSRVGLGVGPGFAEAGDAVARVPLAAFFKDRDALEALEDVAFCTGGAGGAQAAML